ncbi:MAG: hypothetical protein R3C14_23970 [Caldilineaceae bacterium]
MNLRSFTIHPLEPSSASPQALPLNGHHFSAIQDSEIVPADDPLLDDFQPEVTLPPISLITIGPFAHAIATQTAAVGAAWLSWPPVIHLFPVGAEGKIAKQMGNLPPSPLAAGATQTNRLAGEDPLPMWLLLDLCVDQPPAVAAAVVDQRITWARQQLQRLLVAACREEGDHAPILLLILADPARQADLEHCRRRLTPLVPGPFYLLGAPIEEVETPAWQQRAATALAALLWANIPKPSAIFTNRRMEASTVTPAHMAIPAQFYAIGAASQPLPTTSLIRTLALLTASEAIHARLAPAVTDGPVDESGAPSSLVHLVTQLFAPEEVLTSEAPPPVRLRRTQPRWWRTSAHPVPMLLAYHNQQQRIQQVADHKVRSTWLASRLAQWDAAWQSFSRILPRPPDNGVDPLHDTTPLEQLRRQILTLAQEVDEALCALAHTLETHEAQTQRECQQLAAFCAPLPTLSFSGIWHFCRRPHHWPRWLWQLAVGLPWRLHRLSRCLTVQEKTLYQEANLHLRRQLALAMAQDVQLALAWQHELRGHLTALAAYLDEQLTVSMQALPAPWDRERVEALRQQLIRTDEVSRQAGMQALSALLQRTAADEWVDGATAAIGENLLEHFAATFVPLQQWSVTAWLRATFPPSSRPETDTPEKGRWSRRHNGAPSPAAAAIAHWLDPLLREAIPLWPSSTRLTADQSDHTLAQWLILPAPQSDAFDPALSTTPAETHPALTHWSNAQPNRSYHFAALREVVVVQRISVL